MTARAERALRPARWIGHCHRCRREDREVQTRCEHGARTLCDDCYARTPPPTANAAIEQPHCWTCDTATGVEWFPVADSWLCPTHAPPSGAAAANRVDPGEISPERLNDSSHTLGMRGTAASIAPLSADVPVIPHSSSLIPHTNKEKKGRWGTDEPEVEWLLAEYDARLVEPVRVDLPPLPDSATGPMRDVAWFYALVRGLRLWAGDDRPVPFGCEWVAGKVDLPTMTVWRAIKQLADCGVLVLAGALPGRDKRGTFLYAPGALPPGALGVEPDDAAGRAFELRQEVGEEVAVRQAVADDRGEVREGDGGLGAPVGGAGGEQVRAVIGIGHVAETSGGAGGTPTNRRGDGAGMTREEVARLERLPRPKRLKRLWEAMSPGAQERVWEALDNDARVDLIAASFDAAEEIGRVKATAR